MSSRTRKLLAPELVRGAINKRRKLLRLLILLLFLGGSGLSAFHFLRDPSGHFSLDGGGVADNARAELYDDIGGAVKKGFIFNETAAYSGQLGGAGASGQGAGRDGGAGLVGGSGHGADMSGSRVMVTAGEGMQGSANGGGSSSGGGNDAGSGRMRGPAGMPGMALGPGGVAGKSGDMGTDTGVQVSVTGSDKMESKNGGYHTNAGGVMDALNRAAQAAYEGEKIASYDTAHIWVSQTFDQRKFTDKALQYSGAAAALDKMDPNAIPNYLRKDAFSLSRADTLGAPSVKSIDSSSAQGPGADQTVSTAKYIASNSVMNTVFAGVGGLLGGQQPSPQNQGGSSGGGSYSGDETVGSVNSQSGAASGCVNSCTEAACQMGCYE